MPNDAEHALERVLRAGRAGIRGDADRAGVKLVSLLRLDLSRPGLGRVYTHYFWTDSAGRLRRGRKRWKPHRASRPGDPPTVDTGVLRASYGHMAVWVSPEAAELVIQSGDHKVAFLEFGTSKMKARPHLRPLMHRHGRIVTDEVAAGITRRERIEARRSGGEG